MHPRSIAGEKAPTFVRQTLFITGVGCALTRGGAAVALRIRLFGRRIRLDASDRIKLLRSPTMEPIVARSESGGGGGGGKRPQDTLMASFHRSSYTVERIFALVYYDVNPCRPCNGLYF